MTRTGAQGNMELIALGVVRIELVIKVHVGLCGQFYGEVNQC